MTFVYLLHFNQPFKHAKHYTGFAEDLESRLSQHMAGRGSNLTRAAYAAGIRFTIARTWTNKDRAFERSLKKRGGAIRYCPICKGQAAILEHKQGGDPAHEI